MFKIKRSADRGYQKLDWLESYFSFSFGNYWNPKDMNFSHLRVINEDYIQPKTGFGFHPHRDMEIITFMLEGELTHKDNLGNTGVLKAGNVQLMRAGTGIVHSEVNNSESEVAHLMQIWVMPNEAGLAPGWWEMAFNDDAPILTLVSPKNSKVDVRRINPDLNDTELKIAQDGYIFKSKGQKVFDVSALGQSDIYIQSIGNSTIEIDGSVYALSDGDALYGQTNTNDSKIALQSDNIALIFAFPKK